MRSKRISFYYQPMSKSVNSSDDLARLIDMHILSFERHGWELVQVDEEVASQHPLYHLFTDQNSVLASSNNAWEYTRACYLRWLAYAQVGNYFADFDVMNYGFTPDDAERLVGSKVEDSPLMLSEAGAMGLLTPSDYGRLIQTFTDFIAKPVVSGGMEQDIKDMTILREAHRDWYYHTIPYEDIRFVKDYTALGWDQAKLVHYPYSFTPVPRAPEISRVRPIDRNSPEQEVQTQGNHGMNRSDVIQRLLALTDDTEYLEIGVQAGITFDAVQARKKTAVDPAFAFDVQSARAASSGKTVVYVEKPSDIYFATLAKPFPEFDVIFIDGLHTFEQTLRDLMNSLPLLKRGGILVIDDVLPVTYASSISDIKEFDHFRMLAGIEEGYWMGDVYKLVFFIEQYLTMFSFATVAENHGQTILWQSPRHRTTGNIESVSGIAGLTFSDSVRRRDVFNIMPLDKIEQKIMAARF